MKNEKIVEVLVDLGNKAEEKMQRDQLFLRMVQFLNVWIVLIFNMIQK